MKLNSTTIAIIAIIVVLFREEIREKIDLLMQSYDQEPPLRAGVDHSTIKSMVVDYFQGSNKAKLIASEQADPNGIHTHQAMEYLTHNGATPSQALIEIKKYVATWNRNFISNSDYAQ